MNEVRGLLDAGGAAMLQQGVQDGFESLPPEYRGIAMQTARLIGFTTETPQPGDVMSVAELAQRLEALSSTSSQLVDASKLDIVSALGQDPAQRAAALAPQVHRLMGAGRTVGAAISQVPVAQLRANEDFVQKQLHDWSCATETLHEQLKAQFGPTDMTTVFALQARTESAAAYGKTMMRIKVANLGSMAFNVTVGPVVAGLSRLFGAGN